MSIPTNIARLVGSRAGAGILTSFFRRQPETKNQLVRLGLARFAVSPFGNAENGRGRGYGKWNFTNIGSAGAAGVAVGTIAAFGIGFGISVANCAGKDDKIDKEEAMIAQAYQDLTKALSIKHKAMDATEAALRAYCQAAAIGLVKFLTEAACFCMTQGTLESARYEDMQSEASQLDVQLCEKVKDALTKDQIAWELLRKLREIVENGKDCKYTSGNQLLITAEEFLLRAERAIVSAKALLDFVSSGSDPKMLAQYRELVDEFLNEMNAVLGAMPPECVTAFTSNGSEIMTMSMGLKINQSRM